MIVFKKQQKKVQKYALRDGISHFRSNHETPPQRLSLMVSHPEPETKKFHDFQSWKEEWNPETIL